MICICATKKSLIKKFCCTARRVALPEAYKDLLFKSLALRLLIRNFLDLLFWRARLLVKTENKL